MLDDQKLLLDPKDHEGSWKSHKIVFLVNNMEENQNKSEEPFSSRINEIENTTNAVVEVRATNDPGALMIKRERLYSSEEFTAPSGGIGIKIKVKKNSPNKKNKKVKVKLKKTLRDQANLDLSPSNSPSPSSSINNDQDQSPVIASSRGFGLKIRDDLLGPVSIETTRAEDSTKPDGEQSPPSPTNPLVSPPRGDHDQSLMIAGPDNPDPISQYVISSMGDSQTLCNTGIIADVGMPKDDSVTPNNDTHPPPIVPLPNVPKYVSELHPVPNTVPDSIIEENVVPEPSENRILSPQPGPSGLQQRKDFPLQLDLSSDSGDDDIQVVQEDIQVVKISRNKNSPKNNPNTSSKKRSIEEVDLTSENDGVSVTFDNRVLSKSIFTRDISRENSNDANQQQQPIQNSKGLLETTSCVLCSKWTDIYFHCTVCENYNLCLSCFMKNIVPHHHREVETNVDGLSEKPMNIEVSYETAKKYGVQECLKTLVHASTCSVSYNTSKCKFTNLPCSIMKRLIRHAKTCCYDYPMSLCTSCKNYISLCVRHAKGCQENQCPVLLCDKINRRQQEQHVPEQQQLQSQNNPETTNTTTSREEFYRNHLEPTKNEMDQYIQPTVSQPQPSTSSSSTGNPPITNSTIDEAELNDLLSDLESDIERRRLSRSNSLDQPSLLDNAPNNMIEQPPTPEVDPLLGPILAGLEPNVLKQWENDELLGKHSRVAMILFANLEHPELKFQYPSWNDRLKMIYSLWKNVNPLTSEKYRRKAERNIENQRRAISAPIANLSQDTTESTSNYRNQLLKLKNDELLGNQATIAMILYSNQNHPELKSHYPEWNDRVKQITKIWKNLPTLSRHQYVQNARQNRTASRIQITNHNLNNPPQDMSGQQWLNSNVQQQPQPGPPPQNLGATSLPTPPLPLPAKKRYIPPYTPGRSATSIAPPPPSDGVMELYRANGGSNMISNYNPATIQTPLAQQKPQQNTPAQKQNPAALSASGSDKNKPANNSFNCSICFDPPDQMYMFLNCGHLPFCDSCSKQIMKVKGAKCPICREKVSKRVRAFFQQT